MARFRRFRKSFRSFRGRAGASYRRYGGARGIAGMSMPYLAGAAAGYFGGQYLGANQQIVDNVALASVALPTSITRKLGPARQLGQGYLLGRLVKSLISSNFNVQQTVSGHIV